MGSILGLHRINAWLGDDVGYVSSFEKGGFCSMKDYWKALLFIILSSFLYQVLYEYVPQLRWLFVLLWIAILLVFGYLLSPNKKRSNRWLGKVIISIFVIFTIGFRLNLFAVVGLDRWVIFKGIGSSFLDLLLVYCGWSFYQL